VSHITDKLTDERGSALIELLVAIPASLAVFGAVASLSGVFGTSQRVTQERSESIQEQQVGAAQMTKEIRQATTATVVSPQELLVTTPRVAGQVRFLCTGDSCTRSVVALDGTESTRIEFVTGLDDDDVFSKPPDNPSFVSISLHVDGGNGERDLSIDDGVAVTNAS
jgi:hypothetical protein